MIHKPCARAFHMETHLHSTKKIGKIFEKENFNLKRLSKTINWLRKNIRNCAWSSKTPFLNLRLAKKIFCEVTEKITNLTSQNVHTDTLSCVKAKKMRENKSYKQMLGV